MSETALGSALDSEDPGGTSNSTYHVQLDRLIREIGVARFAGRISAGIIGELAGYEAIERFIKSDVERPLFSKLSQALLRRPNSYESD